MIQILLLIFSLSTFAKLDLSLGVQGRTLPSLGAEAYFDSGLNMVWWGQKKSPKDVLYGLIRPSLAFSSSGVINSGKAELEFFPISFMGISAGRQIQNSNYDFPFFDCEEVVCQGEFVRNFVEAKMVLGLKGWILLGNHKVETYRGPSRTRPLADWRNVIVGNPGEDVQVERKLLFAKTWSNKLAGVLAEHVQFQGSREFKESFAAVYQVRRGQTSYMIGAGPFRTSQQGQGVIFYFRLHHVALPSLKLF